MFTGSRRPSRVAAVYEFPVLHSFFGGFARLGVLCIGAYSLLLVSTSPHHCKQQILIGPFGSGVVVEGARK